MKLINNHTTIKSIRHFTQNICLFIILGLATLTSAQTNSYLWTVSQDSSWEDLKLFLPNAKMEGISVWVYLMPPSKSPPLCTSCNFSEPFRLDFIQWAEEIAKLSLRYSNVKGYAIVDLFENVNLGYLRQTYIDSLITAGKSINPKLQFDMLTPPHKTYYVSNSGNDSYTGLSQDSAWATLSKINNLILNPGDSVLFKKGDSWIGGNTIHGSWSSLLYIDDSGTSTNPIVIATYGTGNKPYLRSDAGQYKSGIILAGNYMVLDGLDIDSCQYGATATTGSNNIIQNCEIRHCGIGASLYARDNLFTHNYVHSGIMTKNTVGGGGDDYGAIGVLIIEPKNEVSYCTFDSLMAPSYDFGYDGNFIEFFPNGASSSVDSCYIHHNIATQCNAIIEIYKFSGSATARDITYAYNLFNFNAAYDKSQIFAIHTGFITYENLNFENNTIYVNSNNETTSDGLIAWGTLVPGSLFFYNNIIAADSCRIVSAWVGSGSIEGTNNLFYRYDGISTLGFTLGTLGIRENPKLADVNNNNFVPVTGSPVIDAGIDMGYTTDVLGNPIVGNPNIGAYENVESY